MTVAHPETTAVTPFVTDTGQALGLEDVTSADLSTPRLKVVGKTAKFKNTLTGEEFDELDVVLISQIRQRVMFDKDVDGTYKRPQCRSTDFATGFPNVDPAAPKDKAFPWADSNFQSEAGMQGQYLREVLEVTGLPALPCDKCKFKDWENKKTRCREQHVYPLVYRDEDGIWVPAILSIAGSSIKNSKTYVSPFAVSKTPLFTVVTHLTLTAASRAAVDYAIVNFRKVGPSDPGSQEEYADTSRTMREYLRAWPTKDNDSDSVIEDTNQNTGPTVIDVAPPAPVPAPAVATAPPAVVPPPAAPAMPPVAPVAPPAQPVAPPVQPAPVPAPALPSIEPPVQPAAPPVQPPAPPVAPPVAPAAPADPEADAMAKLRARGVEAVPPGMSAVQYLTFLEWQASSTPSQPATAPQPAAAAPATAPAASTPPPASQPAAATTAPSASSDLPF